jgi:uncharacterized protein (UPF0147 family)
MKKIAAFLFLTIVTVSCYTDEDQRLLQERCRQLSSQKAYLEQRVETLQSEVHDLSVTKNALRSGREIKYIVKFKIKQGTFTLDIFEHAKNVRTAYILGALDESVKKDGLLPGRLRVGMQRNEIMMIKIKLMLDKENNDN